MIKLGKKKTNHREQDRYIEFTLGMEEFAVPLLNILEVISPAGTTPIPNSPKHLLGIINLRGEIIPIVDLRIKMNITSIPNKEEAVIIIEHTGKKIGLIVDAINKVLIFYKDEVAEFPELNTNANSEYILGVYRKEKKLTLLLDVVKVLDKKDFLIKQSDMAA